MNRITKTAACLIAYPVIATFTFAYAASDPGSCSRYDCPPRFEGAMSGMTAGLFWPLYWPWEVAEALRGEAAYARRAAELAEEEAEQ